MAERVDDDGMVTVDVAVCPLGERMAIVELGGDRVSAGWVLRVCKHRHRTPEAAVPCIVAFARALNAGEYEVLSAAVVDSAVARG
jgi:hypothetical protein